jgi:hypothetical protein
MLLGLSYGMSAEPKARPTGKPANDSPKPSKTDTSGVYFEVIIRKGNEKRTTRFTDPQKAITALQEVDPLLVIAHRYWLWKEIGQGADIAEAKIAEAQKDGFVSENYKAPDFRNEAVMVRFMQEIIQRGGRSWKDPKIVVRVNDHKQTYWDPAQAIEICRDVIKVQEKQRYREEFKLPELPEPGQRGRWTVKVWFGR